MGADQCEIEHEWYSHLGHGRGINRRTIMDEGTETNQTNRASSRALHKLVVSFTAMHTFVRLA
jgi:hypothetical protein